jgi:ribonuclease HI
MNRDQILQLYVDGASKGNPGEAGVGVVLRDGDGKAIASLSRYIGKATNNQAEYRGLIIGLQEALALGYRELIIFTDSELMERQIKGQYRVKDKTLKQYHSRTLELLESFRSYRIRSIPRAENKEADRLASQAAKNQKSEDGSPD